MTKTSWRRITLALPCVPVACGLIATALFYSQGGFGAGHGHFDLMIGALALPAVGLLGFGFPTPRFVESMDLLLIIWYPALLNSLFFWTPLACFLYRAGRLQSGR